ncbi:TetR/AcrR family transcriptional regulator [Paenibacillus tyrfis]|nr:TetR/AcrR family transcriptional regulator [Paenibacillus tyrfis]
MMDEDIRIFKSKQNIRRAFIELLHEKSFNKITIQDIVDKALTGRSTFYNHYMDKYDLLEQLVEQHTRAFRTLIEKRYQATRPQEVRRLIEEILNSIVMHRDEIGTLLEVHLPNADLRKNMEDILYQSSLHYLSDTVKEPSVPLDYIASLYSANVITLISWTIKNGKNPDTIELADKLQSFVFGVVQQG